MTIMARLEDGIVSLQRVMHKFSQAGGVLERLDAVDNPEVAKKIAQALSALDRADKAAFAAQEAMQKMGQKAAGWKE